MTSKNKDKTGRKMALAKVNKMKNGNTSSNLFLDILKVAPLVEITEDDGSSVRTASQTEWKFDEDEEEDLNTSNNSKISSRSYADLQSSSFSHSPHHDSTIFIDDSLMTAVGRCERSLVAAIDRSETSLMEFEPIDISGGKKTSAAQNGENGALPVFIPLSSNDWPEDAFSSHDGIQSISAVRKNKFVEEDFQQERGAKRSINGNIRTKMTSIRHVSISPKMSKNARKKKSKKLKLAAAASRLNGLRSVEEVVLEEDTDDGDEVVFVEEVTPPSTSSHSVKGSKRSNLKRLSASFSKKLSAKLTKNKAIGTNGKAMCSSKFSSVVRDSVEKCVSPTAFALATDEHETKNRFETFISRIRPAFLSPPVPPNKYILQGLRYFEEIQGREVASAHQFQSQSLKIVSYNVLCQSTMQRTRFLYTHLHGANTRFGVWGQRARLLGLEFDRLQADIFCLQEVEDAHVESFYRPFFEKLGYAGVYCRKTNNKPDGCAIFYSATKFYPRRCFDVFYNLNAEPMNCDNVGQVLALEILGTNSVVCVSNTHLIYNPKRGTTKISQIAFLIGKMNEMERMIRSEMSPTEHFVGHILCGDFNMEPFSPIYRFLVDAKLNMHEFTSQQLACSFEDLDIVNVEERRASDGGGTARVNLGLMRLSSSCTFQTAKTFLMSDTSACKHLTHTLKLASAYEHRLADSSKEISIRPVDEALCPDFIFYTVGEPKTSDTPIAESYIQLRGRLTLPCLRDLDNACGPMPNNQTGSDHLPLMVHFELLCK